MKNIKLLYFVSIVLFVTACGDGSPKKEAYADKSSAVCIWDKASLRKEAGRDAKWLSAISLGEKLTYLEEEVEKDERNKKIKYLKVKLLDGKEGWVRADFVAVGSIVAVVVEKTNTYGRPDLSTVSKNAFEMLDIIAIKSTQDDWTEVIGKRQGAKWIETAWIKSKNLSYEEKDVAVALYIGRAKKNKKDEDKIAELKKINQISDLQGSVFDDLVNELLNDLVEDEEMEIDSVSEQQMNEDAAEAQAAEAEAANQVTTDSVAIVK